MVQARPDGFDATWYWWLPPGHSSYSHDIDHLFHWIFWITMVTFVGVELVMLWFCFKYRRNPARKPIYSQGSHNLEVAWTIIPALILVALGVLSSKTWAKIKNYNDPDYPKTFQTTLKIVAHQFAWEVYYPGADGVFDTPDDFKKTNQLNVPFEPTDADGKAITDENVRVMLTSQDVIHSFFVPVLRMKQDAVPGYIGNVWFDVQRMTMPGPDGKHLSETATHPDVTYSDDGRTRTNWEEYYEVACAELCGIGHSRMRMTLKAVPRKDWEAWVKAESAAVLNPPKH